MPGYTSIIERKSLLSEIVEKLYFRKIGGNSKNALVRYEKFHRPQKVHLPWAKVSRTIYLDIVETSRPESKF